MFKPSKEDLELWINNKTKLCFHYKDGRDKYGYIKSTFALSAFIKVENSGRSRSTDVVLFSKLENIYEPS